MRNALVLGKEKEDESSLSSKSHRLSKELIQSCIRPILLNLRDHTKLSLPLLRGLSRLLGLLSSWFNKTLGEKLLEHLHKFGEPGKYSYCFVSVSGSGSIALLISLRVTNFVDKIMRLQVFNPGDEPLIAAAVLDLFALLPQASHFVESLVKQTIRLESALPKYKPCRSISPFRDPLAKYLNRHFASECNISCTCFSIERRADVHIACFFSTRCCRFLLGGSPPLQPGLFKLISGHSDSRGYCTDSEISFGKQCHVD